VCGGEFRCCCCSTVARRYARPIAVGGYPREISRLGKRYWKKALENADAQQPLDADIFRRASLGLLDDHPPTK
jgi:hypothetical protein